MCATDAPQWAIRRRMGLVDPLRVIPDREWAWAIVNEYTQSEQLKRHMLRQRGGNPGSPREPSLLRGAALGRRLTRPGKAGPTRIGGAHTN